MANCSGVIPFQLVAEVEMFVSRFNLKSMIEGFVVNYVSVSLLGIEVVPLILPIDVLNNELTSKI